MKKIYINLRNVKLCLMLSHASKEYNPIAMIPYNVSVILNCSMKSST